MTEPVTNPGARPVGATSETAAAATVRQMFNDIAPTYDQANHLLSVGLDRMWWRRAARTFVTVLSRPDAQILDLCCGTGDMTAALLKFRSRGGECAPVIGLDFSAEMLARARAKFAGANAVWMEGDALHLPFADASLDLVTAAFGFRNLSNYSAGLVEIRRVLRPGGQFGILEANQPAGLIGVLYSLYFKRILPILGGAISGQLSAYRYLPASVERFPRPRRMLELIREAGFIDGRWDSYTFGTSGLYRGTRHSERAL